MSSFTDQKSRIATEKDCKAPWSGGKNGKYFRCYLCGYKFKVGDRWRWVHTNHTKDGVGNPIVCEKCDGTNEEVIKKWIEKRNLWRKMEQGEWWWFNKGRSE